ncbi:MAG: hypothetical protein RR053_07250 [Evtepia sp.]
MLNYQEMYFDLFRATDKAVSALISVQREMEEKFLLESESEPDVTAIMQEEER